MIFDDRRQAGRLLAQRLLPDRPSDGVVLGLPRGGVPVAWEVAQVLRLPLDVIIVRKLGVPYQPELGMGAIGEGGVRVLTEEIVRLARVSPAEIDAVEARERRTVEERAIRYRRGHPAISLDGRTAIIVDDGIATGGTARAAIQVARVHGARRVVLAVPVAAAESVAELQALADEVVALQAPFDLYGVGAWYRDFGQTSDDEVVRILDVARCAAAGTDEEVAIPADGVRLGGHLTVPAGASGVVVFAHGSGSSRHSPRNRSVAEVLHDAGIATLLFDLLTEREADDRGNVFDIALLAGRLHEATAWLATRTDAGPLPLGYFGASTGAAAALWAAAEPGSPAVAVVSRGGRPDLAAPRLGAVRAPTLLIVGSRDESVLELNREAAAQLRCEHRVAVVPGATHLFEEPGTLAEAAGLARDWFAQHFRGAGGSARVSC